MKRKQQAIGVERRLAGPRLADKSVYGNQTLADRIDCEEKTFKSHGTEECRTVGRNKAGGSDFIAIQRQPCLCHGAYVSLSASDYDTLRTSRLQLKPFRQRSGHHAKSSAGINKELNVFDMSRGARQMPLYMKKSHLNAFSQTCCILTQTPANTTSVISKQLNPHRLFTLHETRKITYHK
jgi:hypothetical protein